MLKNRIGLAVHFRDMTELFAATRHEGKAYGKGSYMSAWRSGTLCEKRCSD